MWKLQPSLYGIDRAVFKQLTVLLMVILRLQVEHWLWLHLGLLLGLCKTSCLLKTVLLWQTERYLEKQSMYQRLATVDLNQVLNYTLKIFLSSTIQNLKYQGSACQKQVCLTSTF